MKKFSYLILALAGSMACPVSADILGLVNGRSANLDNMEDMSVEGGANFSSDVTNFAGRFNYKLSQDLLLFGDLGMYNEESDFFGFKVEADGIVFGVGAYYYLRSVELLENTDFAVKGSYHTGSLEFKNCSTGCEFDTSEIAIEGIISGDQVASTSFGWYANVGLHIVGAKADGESTDDKELLIGGGVVGPLSFGDWYAGVDLVDGVLFGAGVRYNFY